MTSNNTSHIPDEVERRDHFSIHPDKPLVKVVNCIPIGGQSLWEQTTYRLDSICDVIEFVSSKGPEILIEHNRYVIYNNPRFIPPFPLCLLWGPVLITTPKPLQVKMIWLPKDVRRKVEDRNNYVDKENLVLFQNGQARKLFNNEKPYDVLSICEGYDLSETK
jgi:hypothetical protein